MENLLNTGTTATLNTWSQPSRVDVREYPDKIEMIYKQTSMITYTTWPGQPPQERVFKIVFSCVDGKWHKSEPIFGTITPARDEDYDFED